MNKIRFILYFAVFFSASQEDKSCHQDWAVSVILTLKGGSINGTFLVQPSIIRAMENLLNKLMCVENLLLFDDFLISYIKSNNIGLFIYLK